MALKPEDEAQLLLYNIHINRGVNPEVARDMGYQVPEEDEPQHEPNFPVNHLAKVIPITGISLDIAPSSDQYEVYDLLKGDNETPQLDDTSERDIIKVDRPDSSYGEQTKIAA